MEQLEQVVRQYADTVYRLALAHMHNPADADDVFQDVFLRYAENLRSLPARSIAKHG